MLYVVKNRAPVLMKLQHRSGCRTEAPSHVLGHYSGDQKKDCSQEMHIDVIVSLSCPGAQRLLFSFALFSKADRDGIASENAGRLGQNLNVSHQILSLSDNKLQTHAF